MSWFSILPAQLSFYEVWIVRFFLFLGLVSIGPWIALILYDFLLYIWRTATYEIPVIGGRAKGRQRPRAPSLTERPKELARRLSLSASASSGRSESPAKATAMSSSAAPPVAQRRQEATYQDD